MDYWARARIEYVKHPVSSSQVICMSDFASCIDIVARNLIMGMSHIKNLGNATKLKTILCAGVGATGHQHRSETCTVCGRSGNMSNNTGSVCIM